MFHLIVKSIEEEKGEVENSWLSQQQAGKEGEKAKKNKAHRKH